MNDEQALTVVEQWQQQAEQSRIKGSYAEAVSFYEQALIAEPDVKSHYWYLGLAFLLQGQEVEAQTTWLMAMIQGESEQVEEWTDQLNQILQTEAIRQADFDHHALSWAIRQQLREICPSDINNLLHLILLAIQQQTYTGQELSELGILELLERGTDVSPDWQLLISVLKNVLDHAPLHDTTLALADACAAFANAETQSITLIAIVFRAALDIAYSQKQPKIAASLLEVGLRLVPNNPELLYHLSGFYEKCEEHEKGIEAAKKLYSLAESLPEKISANLSVLRGLMAAGGHWEESLSILQRQKLLLEALIESQPMPLDTVVVNRLINSSFFFPYFHDCPQDFRQIQNQLAQLYHTNIEIAAKEQIAQYHQGRQERQQTRPKNKPLKIGYLSYCLRNHSVGWLARWLIEHHDRERFQIYGYFLVSNPEHEPLYQWYLSQFYQSYKSKNARETAEKIYHDEIDILIDMDSLTLDLSCEVVALKPAPIQVSWLGWDASGIPTIDYFLADSYVLPNSSQEYYSEKIWRLPHSYIAVDGFEVGIPSLRREELEIEADAVIYLSAQKGFKRHPETAKLQMQIIKAVPDSYFLIKGWGDDEAIKRFFIDLAQEQGVDSSRLRFLPLDLSEADHRANLGIADVVLDTYPYNGATTTLEVLWMGIPLVTRVGEQFAARNSYTMMMNAGITEGIAWSAAEYVEWGIRLGKDEVLRQQIAWKLRKSRQTSPLWNGKQFTRDVENAYEQMWQKYIDVS